MSLNDSLSIIISHPQATIPLVLYGTGDIVGSVSKFRLISTDNDLL